MQANEKTQPNIIFILADDLGYGDLSSYGATDISTPNIDRLATEGIRFTDHYTPANTCSPSRASLMTGRYPPRTRVNAVISYDSVDGLPLEEVTMAEVLRDAGYATGMVGKWHLGQVEAFMPWWQGFDEFFGVATSNDDNNFFLYESKGLDYQRFPEEVDQTTLMQKYNQHALAFIDNHANGPQPFFLYFSHTAAHVPLHPGAAFVGTSKRGIYGDVVQELDDSVGQVLRKLTELGIDDNTLVVFTSDNGGWRTMRDRGGSNGILREGKLTAFDGGHRVPALVRWPKHIPAGVVSQQLVTMMDWLPTFADLIGLTLSSDIVIDGKTLKPIFFKEGERANEPFFFFALRPPHEEQGYRLAGVREGQWKYKAAQTGYYPKILEPLMKVGLYHHGELLFDVEADPAESENLMNSKPVVAEHMRTLLRDFAQNNIFPEPINIESAPRDGAGWEKLWIGISEALALLLFILVLVIAFFVKLVKRYLKQ